MEVYHVTNPADLLKRNHKSIMRQNIFKQFSIRYALSSKTATISEKYDLKSYKVQTYKNHKPYFTYCAFKTNASHFMRTELH